MKRPDISERNRTNPPANWLKKLPTKPGYYWYRRGNTQAVIVHVIRNVYKESDLAVWFFGNEVEVPLHSEIFGSDCKWKRVTK